MRLAVILIFDLLLLLLLLIVAIARWVLILLDGYVKALEDDAPAVNSRVEVKAVAAALLVLLVMVVRLC